MSAGTSNHRQGSERGYDGVTVRCLETDCTPPQDRGRAHWMRLSVTHPMGSDELTVQVLQDDVVAYACPDYTLATLTGEQVAAAVEAQATSWHVDMCAQWLRVQARSGRPLRVYPQYLDELKRRPRRRALSEALAAPRHV
jgi:hypothetical protein